MKYQRYRSKNCFTLFFLIAFLWFGLINSLWATPTFPHLGGHVVDPTHALQPATCEALEASLTNHTSRTSNQVVVVILKTLDGHEIADYGHQLGRHWGIGQKDKNNGVLLIIALEDRQIRIEVGYGLEGVLTDAKTKFIIEQIIIPKFKAGKLDQGVQEGIDHILQLLDGKPMESPESTANPWAVLLIVFFFFAFIVLYWRNGGGGNGRGGLGGDSDRGGFFGGGGGFSGGGGSFGGGGSSGKW